MGRQLFALQGGFRRLMQGSETSLSTRYSLSNIHSHNFCAKQRRRQRENREKPINGKAKLIQSPPLQKQALSVEMCGNEG